jgi:hypothetical protein
MAEDVYRIDKYKADDLAEVRLKTQLPEPENGATRMYPSVNS